MKVLPTVTFIGACCHRTGQRAFYSLANNGVAEALKGINFHLESIKMG